MVSNTMEDLPEPDTPVKMVILRLGMRNDTFFRLFSRAPRISIYSWDTMLSFCHLTHRETTSPNFPHVGACQAVTPRSTCIQNCRSNDDYGINIWFGIWEFYRRRFKQNKCTALMANCQCGSFPPRCTCA